MAQYFILLGERSNGKSYAVKERCVSEAFHNGILFGYLRRWQVDIKATYVDAYFSDCPVSAITNGEYNTITCYRQRIYLANIDAETGITTRGKEIGFCFYLSGVTHFKSMSLPKFGNVIFEEFVTNSGYMKAEIGELFDLVSTIARRESINVFMIGNTITRLCPYFSEWQLTGIPKMNQGDIEVYEREAEGQFDENGNKIFVKIAVERCESSGKAGRMFFGAKSKMINSGAWDCEPQPHLPFKLERCQRKYNVLYNYRDFTFNLELVKTPENSYLVFCYPYTKKRINVEERTKTRIVSDKWSQYSNVTETLEPLCKGDETILKLIKQNKICFSDNLTGTEFKLVLKEKGGRI